MLVKPQKDEPKLKRANAKYDSTINKLTSKGGVCMLAWITANIRTIIVCAVLAAIVAVSYSEHGEKP